MALTEERIAFIFWTSTISTFLFAILYTSFCILRVGSISPETCAFLEIATVVSVIGFFIGMCYYCYKQKIGLTDTSDMYTHWTLSHHQHYKVPRAPESLVPVADDEVPTDWECSICSEGKDQTLVTRLNCSHFFHKVCIQQWFRSDHHMSCPLCRTPQVRTENLVVLTIVHPSNQITTEI